MNFTYYGDVPDRSVRLRDDGYLVMSGTAMKILRVLNRIPEKLDECVAAFQETDATVIVAKGSLKFELDPYWVVGRAVLDTAYSGSQFWRFQNVALVPHEGMLYLVGIQGFGPARHPVDGKPLAFYCMDTEDPLLDVLFTHLLA